MALVSPAVAPCAAVELANTSMPTSAPTTPGQFRRLCLEICPSASGNAWMGELSFYTAGAAAPMTLVTTPQTADAALSNARILVEYDNSAIPTLNTDLTAEVTCDNGAHWASASFSSVSTHGQSGHYVAETADAACTPGTIFAGRIKTFNGKNIPIYGVSLSVH